MINVIKIASQLRAAHQTGKACRVPLMTGREMRALVQALGDEKQRQPA